MDKQIAVVTGASSGFGFYTTLELAGRGFQVIAAMRNPENGDKLLAKAYELGCKELVQILKLDVTSENSIKYFKDQLDKMGHVEVLVNNAGFAMAGFVEEIPIEDYRRQFDTNVYGLIMVTQACLPYMRKQRKGNIINISSISGLIGFPGLSPYVASKHAIEGFSECLRLEMKPFGVKVTLIEPGSYKTNIWSTGKHIARRSLVDGSPYDSFMDNIEAYLQKAEKRLGEPQEVAKLIANIAVQGTSNLRYPIGNGVALSIFLKKILSWKSWEKLLLKRLTKS